MAEIVWSSRARNDLASIADYIAEDSPRAARVWLGCISRAVDRLEDFPNSGRIVPEYGDAKIRELIIGNYRVVYRVTTFGVEIARVWHGARPFTYDSMT